MRKIPVLDKGYVRLVTYTPWNMTALEDYLMSEGADVDTARTMLGSNDLAFSNAAKASFLKEDQSLTPGAKKLIGSLAKYFETLPFRHAMVTFEISCPYMVLRQWFKYTVGSEHGPNSGEMLGIPQVLLDALCDGGDDYKLGGDSFSVRSEVSRRYVTIEPEFYIPETWRGAPDNRKQGSQGALNDWKQTIYTRSMGTHIHNSMLLYNHALKDGMAPEQARLFLPFYAMYVHWRWSASLQAITHFLNQRLEHKAQYEIQLYAKAVYDLIKPIYPHSIESLVKHG